VARRSRRGTVRAREEGERTSSGTCQAERPKVRAVGKGTDPEGGEGALDLGEFRRKMRRKGRDSNFYSRRPRREEKSFSAVRG